MPPKKKHHYIPKFYLKRFSSKTEGKLIGVFNKKNEIFIERAKLRNQAYKDFLYGVDDEIENQLGEIENQVARLFDYWTEKKVLCPPPTDSAEYKILTQFILYQSNRIPANGKRLSESINVGAKMLFKEFDPVLYKAIEGNTIVFDNPVLMSLIHSWKYQYFLNFLECKFLVNLSELTFITSDNPVVFYNQLMEKAGVNIGSTGLVCKGLQIFYPIHPRLMICLYDPKVYEFGNGCANCCSSESIEEIQQLNSLQYINSDEQIYFDESISKEYIDYLMNQNSEIISSKPVNKIIKKKSKNYLFTSSESIQIKLDLNFFKLKLNPELFSNNLPPLRHSSFASSSNSKTTLNPKD